MNLLAKLRSVPRFSDWTDITPITKGWSEDTKFRVKIPSGDYYLIRIAKKTDFEQKKQEYNALRHLPLTNLNISRLIDFGLTSSENFSDTIFTWVDGNDAELEIPKLSSSKQYELGRKACIILREIHKVPASSDAPSWGSHFRQKVESRIKSYQEMDVTLDHDKNVIQFLDDNKDLLNGRPQTLQNPFI